MPVTVVAPDRLRSSLSRTRSGEPPTVLGNLLVVTRAGMADPVKDWTGLSANRAFLLLVAWLAATSTPA